MAKTRAKPSDLREACVREALRVIETSGVESLSLRDVARRLGVSHQAPYKHFASRDHILAEIIARAYAAFAAFLDARPPSDDPDESLASMARAYLQYAEEHPLPYRLMFGAPLPDPGRHPEMMTRARHAFSLLTTGLRARADHRGATPDNDAILLDALFIWSTLHGLAGVLQSDALRTLDLPAATKERAVSHTLRRLSAAMRAED